MMKIMENQQVPALDSYYAAACYFSIFNYKKARHKR